MNKYLFRCHCLYIWHLLKVNYLNSTTATLIYDESYNKNGWRSPILRKVWICQRVNQQRLSIEGQVIQCPKEKGQNDLQDTTLKTKQRLNNTNPTKKERGEYRCSKIVSSSCYTSDRIQVLQNSKQFLLH